MWSVDTNFSAVDVCAAPTRLASRCYFKIALPTGQLLLAQLENDNSVFQRPNTSFLRQKEKKNAIICVIVLCN